MCYSNHNFSGMENCLLSFYNYIYNYYIQFNMAKFAIILILVGLSVMASAYTVKRPYHYYVDQGVQTDERAQLVGYLQGIQR